jgi:hypothetical protein
MYRVLITFISLLIFVCVDVYAFEYSDEQASTFENVPAFQSLDDYLIGSGLLQLKMQKDYQDSLIDAINNLSRNGDTLALDSLLGGLLGGSAGGGVAGIGTLQLNTNIGHFNQNVTTINGSNNTNTSTQSNSGFINNSNNNSTSFLNQPNNSGTSSNSVGNNTNSTTNN